MSTDEPGAPAPSLAEPSVPPSPATARPARSKSALREFLETVVLALIAFLVIRTFVMNYRVVGHSMEPNVHEGQYLLIDRLLYRWGAPQRGDIVVLQPPNSGGQTYLKRVIGLPGETVEVRAGQVLINGQAIEEPWVTRSFSQSNWGPAQVGRDEVFVLGDNRPGSRDSRYFGMLARERVLGRAFLCYWPPQAWAVYRRYAGATP